MLCTGEDTAAVGGDAPAGEGGGVEVKKRRTRRPKKKSQLEENFPTYMQVRFLKNCFIDTLEICISKYTHNVLLFELTCYKGIVNEIYKL